MLDIHDYDDDTDHDTDDDGDVGEKFTARESAGDYVRARESS